MQDAPWTHVEADLQFCPTAPNAMWWSARLPSEPGTYEAIVRSYDSAGNAEPIPARTTVRSAKLP